MIFNPKWELLKNHLTFSYLIRDKNRNLKNNDCMLISQSHPIFGLKTTVGRCPVLQK